MHVPGPPRLPAVRHRPGEPVIPSEIPETRGRSPTPRPPRRAWVEHVMGMPVSDPRACRRADPTRPRGRRRRGCSRTCAGSTPSSALAARQRPAAVAAPASSRARPIRGSPRSRELCPGPRLAPTACSAPCDAARRPPPTTRPGWSRAGRSPGAAAHLRHRARDRVQHRCRRRRRRRAPAGAVAGGPVVADRHRRPAPAGRRGHGRHAAPGAVAPRVPRLGVPTSCDPRTGRGINRPGSATVVGPDAARADVWATAALGRPGPCGAADGPGDPAYRLLVALTAGRDGAPPGRRSDAPQNRDLTSPDGGAERCYAASTQPGFSRGARRREPRLSHVCMQRDHGVRSHAPHPHARIRRGAPPASTAGPPHRERPPPLTRCGDVDHPSDRRTSTRPTRPGHHSIITAAGPGSSGRSPTPVVCSSSTRPSALPRPSSAAGAERMPGGGGHGRSHGSRGHHPLCFPASLGGAVTVRAGGARQRVAPAPASADRGTQRLGVARRRSHTKPRHT